MTVVSILPQNLTRHYDPGSQWAMYCEYRWEAQVCGALSRNFSHWSVCMVMYTKLVDRARLAARPVSMLEARPTRVSCVALCLILVRTNWSGLSASRDSYWRITHCV